MARMLAIQPVPSAADDDDGDDDDDDVAYVWSMID